MNKKLIITMIAIACTVSIIIAIVLSIALKKNDNTSKNPNTTEEKTQEELKKEFNNLFNNSVEFNGYDTSNIPKLVENKPIVYTTYELEENKEDKYEVNMYIPVINIKNSVGNEFNAIT